MVGVDTPVEFDGVLVTFPDEVGNGLLEMFMVEALPVTRLVGEDDGLVPLPGEAVPVPATPDAGAALEEFVEVGNMLVPLPNGAVGASAMLVVGVKLVEPVVDDVSAPLVVGIELPKSVREDVPVPVPVPLVVGVEPFEPVGENDVPTSDGVATEFFELMVGDEVGVVVVLPYGGLTELMELP